MGRGGCLYLVWLCRKIRPSQLHVELYGLWQKSVLSKIAAVFWHALTLQPFEVIYKEQADIAAQNICDCETHFAMAPYAGTCK